MVPIYSVESLLALQAEDKKTVIVWETLRETYEAYVIYCFVRYLISGLAQEVSKTEAQGSKKAHQSEDESCISVMEVQMTTHQCRHPTPTPTRRLKMHTMESTWPAFNGALDLG